MKAKVKILFMIGSNLKLGGGGERSLLNYLKNVPEYLKDRLDVTVIQTGSYDRERISTDEIEEVLKAPYIDTITLEKYDFFRIKLSSAGFPDFFARIIWYIFGYPFNRRYIRQIKKATRNADIIYLFQNHFSSFIPRGPIVVGSIHEWLPKSGIIQFLIKKKVIWPRIDCFHYYAPQFINLLPSGYFENFYIPSGIGPVYLVPVVKRENATTLTKLLFVGRLNYCKGVSLILDVFSSLENKGKYELHIVGAGELDFLFKNNMDRVVYHGRIDDEQLQRVYSMSNIFVFPSKCDNLGLVVLEALFAGNLAIVDESLRGAFDEFESLGVLRYSRHDVKDLEKNILEFSNLEYPTEAFEKVRKIILNRYTWNKVSEMLFNKLFELGTQEYGGH